MVDTAAQQHAAELYDDVKTYLARFVVYPSPAALIAHTLWILHTWFMHQWESTPRIAFLSPEPASGKSRALEVTEPLVPRAVHAVNASPAYLFRKVSDPGGAPTILFDEIDTIFGPKAKDNEDIRGMLNAGHRKGAVAGRCVVRGKTVETEALPAYAAVALAGLDDLPDTIMTRSVVVRMRRRLGDEKVEPWRKRINGDDGERLAKRIRAWAWEDGVETAWPDMPQEIQDRDADVWEALLAVADLAGHSWATAARDAAKAFVAASRQRKPSVGVLLLADLRKVFNAANDDKLTTVDVLSALNTMTESPWPTIRRGEPIDARSLANRLGKYGIGSKTVRDGSAVFKGYTRKQFEDAWTRYVPKDDDEGDGELEPPAPVKETSAVTSVTSVADVPDVTAVTDQNLQSRAGAATDQGSTDPRPVGQSQAIKVTGPGRCGECHWHIHTQGHDANCQQKTPAITNGQHS